MQRKLESFISDSNNVTGCKKKYFFKNDADAEKLEILKNSFSEFYLYLSYLKNYQNLNFTGFRKILKKHDKVGAIKISKKIHEYLMSTNLMNILN